MAVKVLGYQLIETGGNSLDALYGTWGSVAEFVNFVNDKGLSTIKNGTRFAVRNSQTVTTKVYVWDSAAPADANGYTYIEIGSGGASSEQLAGKQDKLDEQQISAVNSGVTAAKVAKYDGYESQITSVQTGLNAKQASLNEQQISAVNSGVTAAKVAKYDGYESQITAVQTGLNAKQASLNEQQISAVNSGVTEDKVRLYDGMSIQVSAAQESASNAESSASRASEYITGINTAMQNLPDGQAVSAQVALNTSKLELHESDLEEIGDNISFVNIGDENQVESIAFTANDGTEVFEICDDGVRATSYKNISGETIIESEEESSDSDEIIIGNSENDPTIIINGEGIKVKKITDLEGNEIGSDVNIPTIICPDVFYAVVGCELNIYYDSLFKAMDDGLMSPFGYYVDIQCPDLQTGAINIGVRRERMWQIIGSSLSSSYIGSHSLYIKVYSNKGDLLSYKNCTLVVKSNSGFNAEKNILCIGDSLTNNGPIVKTCADDFSELGGTQPNFIGTRKTSGYYHEGYPGYTFGDFTRSGSSYVQHIFQVPIGTSVAVNDVYSASGNQYKVTDVRTETGTTTSVRCSLQSGSASPSATGTLTKVSGASSSVSSVEYSGYDLQNGNPFWNASTSKIDLTNYLTQFSLQGNLDCAIILLGTNDSISGTANDMTSSVTNAKKIVNAILDDSPSCKVVIQLTPADANTISSWQVYGDVSLGSRKHGYWSNYWKLRSLLYAEFTKSEWAGKVRIGQATQGIDRYYGYDKTQVSSSKRISVQEDYHTNSVHPSNAGYKQFGDGYFLDIIGVL